MIPLFVQWRGGALDLHALRASLLTCLCTPAFTLVGYLLALPTLILPANTLQRPSTLNLLIGLALGPIALAIDVPLVGFHTLINMGLPEGWMWEVSALSSTAVTAVYLYLITPPVERRKR